MKKIGLAFLLIAGVAILSHFISPNIPDLDSFFYLGKAHLIREAGLSDSAFPWMQFSIIKETGSSLWFGFSLFLVPFTFFNNAALGIKLAGVLLTIFALFSCFWVMRRHNLKWPLFWPFLMLFAAPNVTSQLLMTRPQTATIGFAVLLLSFLINGKFWQIFLTAFLLVWIHMNFAWMPLAIGGLVLIVRLIIEKKINISGNVALLVGVLVGWLARPNPFGAANLFYTQVVKQILEKQSGLPLLFGAENFPLSTNILFTNFLLILFIWIAALAITGYLIWRGGWTVENSNKKILIATTAPLSILFFLLSIAVARRAYDFWIIFGIVLIACIFTYFWSGNSNRKNNVVREWITGILITALVFLVMFSGSKTINSLKNSSYPPDYVKSSGEWLNQNTQSGELIFNLNWTHFSPLFLWDRKNHYVSGLDPIFQYAHSPALYWKFHYLSSGLTTDQTCGKIECRQSDMEDTHTVLKNDFKAKYILLSKRFNPGMEQFLSGSRNFEKVFEAVNDVIYRIK